MEHLNQLTIGGRHREGRGKGYARRLRASGYIPANILERATSRPIEIDAKLLSRAWLGDKSFILDLSGERRRVRIHELQINPVRREPLHVDLMYA